MNKTILTALISAGVASLCCIGPILLLTFGAATISSFSFIEPIRLYVSLLALGILGFAYLRVFQKRKEKQCCKADEQKSLQKQKLQKRALLGVTPIVLALLLFPYYFGFLIADDKNKNESLEGVATKWTIEGMSCGACAKGLQGGMVSVEGILKCEVSYKGQSMGCVINDKVLKAEVIPGLVEKMGFKAVPQEVKPEELKSMKGE